MHYNISVLENIKLGFDFFTYQKYWTEYSIPISVNMCDHFLKLSLYRLTFFVNTLRH